MDGVSMCRSSIRLCWEVKKGSVLDATNKFSENAILPACCCVYAWPGKKSFNSGDKQNVTIDSPLLKVLFSYLGKKHKPDHPWNGYKAYSLKQDYKINHPWQAEQ